MAKFGPLTGETNVSCREDTDEQGQSTALENVRIALKNTHGLVATK